MTIEDIFEIHSDQIHRYGGKAGLRDKELLMSAIAQPQAAFEGEYLNKTIFEKAAAYLFHISQNHPFIDGNKRVALVSTLVFLAMNDYPIDYNENQLEKLVWGVAEGRIKKDQIAEFLSKGLG